MGMFSSVLTGSLQGIAERPPPCSYNVIQAVRVLSRRKRGFKSRRGRQIILSCYTDDREGYLGN